MDNCLWPQDFGSNQAEMHRESALLTPWLPPAPDYACYHPTDVAPPWAPPYDGVAEDTSATASRSHSEAEKRRRDRINAQLATLRKLIPKSEKMDKAALLGQVVNQVKEESRRAKEASKLWTIPTETDEVMIEESSPESSTYMKASICCEDRPEFFAELKSAIKGLGITIVEAEVTSLGGRMKINFVVRGKEENASLKQSLKLALSRIVISSGSSSYSGRSKRQRFFYPHLR